jgi:tRNA pseudouridine65 synthase
VFRGDLCSTLAQPALTHYRKLAKIELPVKVDRYPSSRYALLEVEPVTGRRHQIRRHLKHIAHPIIGDATHGKGRHNRYFAEHLGCHRMLLACVRIAFNHPVDGRRLEIKTPVSGDFATTLALFDWLPENP